ncbi:MAG: YhcG family protein [Leptothrix sp. (in: b-proteobacteria)]
MNTLSNTDVPLAGDMRRLIDAARQRVAGRVHTELAQVYWQIGRRIHLEMRKCHGPEQAAQLLEPLIAQLTYDYGRLFDLKNLQQMVQFAEYFPDENIVAALLRHLSWSHFKSLLALEDPYQRDFYAEMCRIEGWSTRMLDHQIESGLYERAAHSHPPELLIHDEIDSAKWGDDRLSSGMAVLKEPYVLGFLGLTNEYLDKGFEAAILRELEYFLLQLGAGFTLVARQKRVLVNHHDYYIDLLLYNRKLKRLVAIDLRLGTLQPRHKGRMEMYLRWLAKFEQEPGEAPPLGIALCTGATTEQIELFELNQSGEDGLHLAEYLAVLPPRAELAARLHQSVQLARERVLRVYDRASPVHH